MAITGKNIFKLMAITGNTYRHSLTVLKGLNPLDVPASINESPRSNLTNTTVANVGCGKQHYSKSSCADPNPSTGDLKVSNRSGARGRRVARIGQ